MQTNTTEEKFGSSPALRLEFLDGLRAFAALWVLFGHIHLFAYGWNHHKNWLTLPLDFFLYLHFGVVVFLVLSGFCLALPIVRNGNKMHLSLLRYIKARANRILPPYYAALCLILLINYFVPLATWGRHAIGLTNQVPWQVLVVNFGLLQDLFPQFNSINGPFWSIATEWHLYFTFPAFIWVLSRFGVKSMLLIGCALACALTWMSFRHPVLSNEFPISVPQPPYFVILFVFGIASAWFAFGNDSAKRMISLRKKGRLLFVILSIAFLFVLWQYRILGSQNVHIFFENLYVLDPIFGLMTALFLIEVSGLSAAHFIRKHLENKVMVFVGGFSYSLYLIHIPILATINHFLENWDFTQNNKHLSFAILSLFGGTICLLSAWYFGKFFETGRWRAIFVKKPLLGNNFSKKNENLIP